MRILITDWPFRLAALSATVLAAAFGISMALVLPRRSLSLTDPIIGHEWILAAALLCLGALLMRFGFPSLPFLRLFARSPAPFAIAAAKVVLLSAGITVLTLAAFNPVAGTRLYIFLDYNPNIGSDARAALAHSLLAERQGWLERGGSEANIRYLPGDTPAIREAVRRLTTASDDAAVLETDRLAALVRSELVASTVAPDLGERILTNLRGIVSEIEGSGRAGDQLVVLSTWRSPPPDWALDIRRFGSRWIQVGGEISYDSAGPLRVQSTEVVHYPGLKPILSILLRAEAAVPLLDPPPELFLTDDGDTDCTDQSGVPVPVGADFPSFRAGSLSTGRFERHAGQKVGENIVEAVTPTERVQFVQIRIVLPTSGPHFACIRLPGAAGSEVNFQRPIPIRVRQLHLAASPDVAAILGTISEAATPSQEGVSSTAPLVVTAEERLAAEPRVEVFKDVGGNPVDEVGSFDLVVLPEVARDQPAVLWNLAVRPRTDPSVNLDVLDHLTVRSVGVSDLVADFENAPPCRETSSIVIAFPEDGPENCRDVLGNRDGTLTLQLPPAGDIEKLLDPQRRALRTVLVMAAAMTWSNGTAPAQPALSRDDYTAVAAATEALGWTPAETPLWRQLVDALLGNTEPRPAANASNGVRPELMPFGLLLLTLAALIGMVRPLMLTIARRHRREGRP